MSDLEWLLSMRDYSHLTNEELDKRHAEEDRLSELTAFNNKKLSFKHLLEASFLRAEIIRRTHDIQRSKA